ncbi:hypothetical protein MKW92_024683, partial [Papaver armeniacum]
VEVHPNKGLSMLWLRLKAKLKPSMGRLHKQLLWALVFLCMNKSIRRVVVLAV